MAKTATATKTTTRTRARARVKPQAVVVPQPPETPQAIKRVRDPNMVADVYLKTNSGVLMLIGKDGDEVREYIEHGTDYSPLDYRFFDDDKKRWAYWASRDGAGVIRPLAFPDPSQYSLTSLVLYTKAVTYTRVLAHAVGLLKEKPTTLWDRMLKPTTIIMGIVGIVFVMGLMLMALTG